MLNFYKKCKEKDLEIMRLQSLLEEKDEHINNLKTAVQLATSEANEYKEFIKNTIGGHIRVDESLGYTLDFNPKSVRQVTQTISIPTFILRSNESHELRAIIDEITRR